MVEAWAIKKKNGSFIIFNTPHSAELLCGDEIVAGSFLTKEEITTFNNQLTQAQQNLQNQITDLQKQLEAKEKFWQEHSLTLLEKQKAGLSNPEE